MRLGVDFGLDHLELEVPEDRLVGMHRARTAEAMPDPGAAVRRALEHPVGFPALRRALTPDDHVAVIVDDRLAHLGEMLVPVLEHVTRAGVEPAAISLVYPAGAQPPEAGALPERFQDVRTEVHDPADRRRLSYLATTRQGRRIYLNRTAVDADQLVVLAARGYDPLLGYSGSVGSIYPALSDEATRHEMFGRLSLAAPGHEPWPALQEAREVAWLLGVPFLVQVIEGAGDDIAHVLAGPADTEEEGQRLLDARWRVTVERPADTVVATVGGDPARHDFTDLARALGCAARVVKPQGQIVLLTHAGPPLAGAAELVRQAPDAGQALGLLRRHTPADTAAAFEWASAVQQASVYLYSRWAGETAEELFTTPLEHPRQAQRLLNGGGTWVYLADAHKTLAVATGDDD